MTAISSITSGTYNTFITK